MLTLDSADALRTYVSALKASGRRIGFVPTMGYLHAGHRALMARLRPQVDVLIVSVYVNPLQFGPGEDLARYPRDPEGDARACQAEGVDVLFLPADLYPPGFATRVKVPALDQGLCAVTRPTHFEGVATVVARLLGLTRADIACFGEKDYQQLAIIRRMVVDLEIPCVIDAGPIIREADGLAMSSRNVYLSPDERRRAPSLRQALGAMADAVAAGERDVATLRELGLRTIDADRLDYLEVVDADSLAPLTAVHRPARAAIAAYYGRTRLIDNLALE
jgi:pantoate--beta-alanine ligase